LLAMWMHFVEALDDSLSLSIISPSLQEMTCAQGHGLKALIDPDWPVLKKGASIMRVLYELFARLGKNQFDGLVWNSLSYRYEFFHSDLESQNTISSYNCFGRFDEFDPGFHEKVSNTVEDLLKLLKRPELSTPGLMELCLGNVLEDLIGDLGSQVHFDLFLASSLGSHNLATFVYDCIPLI